MRLSIIIVNWNTRHLLEDCLLSLCSSVTNSEVEVILVDNGSHDGSAMMVRRKFPYVHVIENQTNRGFAAANNQGLDIARGQYVMLLNSDTIVHGDVLARMIDYLDKHPSIGACGPRILNTDGSLQISSSQFPGFCNLLLLTIGLDRFNGSPWLKKYRHSHMNYDGPTQVETISGCAIMVRRKTIHQIGPLDESFFFFGEETDWCLRMRQNGWLLHYAPVGDITHLGGGSSASLNHHRDLMLSQATVRLHRKHSGITKALSVFLLLFIFNASRAIYWRLFKASNSPKRYSHFYSVTKKFYQAWPRTERKAT